MPIEQEVEGAGKKPGDGAQDAMQQDLQDKEEVQGGSEAEDTIRGFIRDRMHEFIAEVSDAVDAFEAWASSQPEEIKTAFNQSGFFAHIGQQFEREMFNLVGGAGKPLMNGLVGEVETQVSFNEHASHDLSSFLDNALRRGTRDACWYVRDAASGLLGDKWQELSALAQDGSIEFIPALYQLGLPSRAFNPKDFAQTLQDHAESYRMSVGVQRKEVTEDLAQNEKTEEVEQQAQKDMAQEEAKQVVA